jgi:hypothetical protein
LQPLEFGWSPLDCAHHMAHLSAWLLEFPVICLEPFDMGPPSPDLDDDTKWQLQVRFEGYEPRFE